MYFVFVFTHQILYKSAANAMEPISFLHSRSLHAQNPWCRGPLPSNTNTTITVLSNQQLQMQYFIAYIYIKLYDSIYVYPFVHIVN